LIRKSSVYRWFVWGSLLLAYLVTVFHRFSPGIIKDDLSAAYSMSAVAFANLSSMYFYAYMFMQIPTGLLADTLGARLTVTAGMFIAAAGSLLFGLSQVIHFVFIGRFLIGIGVSVVFVCIMKIISKWYNEKEFATMMGLTTFIANIGGTLTQSPLAFMVSILGWRYTFGAAGVITLLITVLCMAVIRNAPEDTDAAGSRKSIKRETVEQEPAKQKEPLDQEPEKQEPVRQESVKQEFFKQEPEKQESLKQEPVRQESVEYESIKHKPAGTEANENDNISKALFAVLRNPYTWPVFLMYVGFYGASQSLAGIWGQGYVMDVYGLSKIDAANKTLYIFIGAAVGSLVLGKLSDTLRKRKLFLFSIGGLNLLCWIYLIFICHGKPPVGALEILLFAFGLSGTVVTLAWACGKEVNDPKYAGISTSIVNMGGFVGAAIVPVFVGNTIDKYKSILDMQQLYVKSFLFCFLSVVLGFICIFFIKETRCRNILHLIKQDKLHSRKQDKSHGEYNQV
jgi:sugar phosphate permease